VADNGKITFNFNELCMYHKEAGYIESDTKKNEGESIRTVGLWNLDGRKRLYRW